VGTPIVNRTVWALLLQTGQCALLLQTGQCGHSYCKQDSVGTPTANRTVGTAIANCKYSSAHFIKLINNVILTT
jgi:hypothetical protein